MHSDSHASKKIKLSFWQTYFLISTIKFSFKVLNSLLQQRRYCRCYCCKRLTCLQLKIVWKLFTLIKKDCRATIRCIFWAWAGFPSEFRHQWCHHSSGKSFSSFRPKYRSKRILTLAGTGNRYRCDLNKVLKSFEML